MKAAFLCLFLAAVASVRAISVCSSNATCTTSGSALTFDTGLSFGTPGLLQRQQALVTALNSANYDFVCLQDAFEPLKKTAITTGASNFTWYSAPRVAQNCSGGCTAGEITQMQTCLTAANCSSAAIPVLCLSDNCWTVAKNLSLSCQRCLGFTSEVNLTDRFTSCNAAASSTCQFELNGNTGVMLGSRVPFATNDFAILSPNAYTASAALYGRVNHPTFGTVHLFCAQQSEATVANVSFSELHTNQSRALLDFVQGTIGNLSSHNDLVLLMGNTFSSSTFNPTGYTVLTAAGFQDASTTANTPLGCTFCANNTLRAPGGTSEVTDHVFFTQNTTSACLNHTQLFGTQIVTIGNVTVPLSDHSGVAARFCAITAGPATTGGAASTGAASTTEVVAATGASTGAVAATTGDVAATTGTPVAASTGVIEAEEQGSGSTAVQLSILVTLAGLGIAALM